MCASPLVLVQKKILFFSQCKAEITRTFFKKIYESDGRKTKISLNFIIVIFVQFFKMIIISV